MLNLQTLTGQFQTFMAANYLLKDFLDGIEQRVKVHFYSDVSRTIVAYLQSINKAQYATQLLSQPLRPNGWCHLPSLSFVLLLQFLTVVEQPMSLAVSKHTDVSHCYQTVHCFPLLSNIPKVFLAILIIQGGRVPYQQGRPFLTRSSCVHQRVCQSLAIAV